MINNGTERSAIWSEIKRVITNYYIHFEIRQKINAHQLYQHIYITIY